MSWQNQVGWIPSKCGSEGEFFPIMKSPLIGNPNTLGLKFNFSTNGNPLPRNPKINMAAFQIAGHICEVYGKPGYTLAQLWTPHSKLILIFFKKR